MLKNNRILFKYSASILISLFLFGCSKPDVQGIYEKTTNNNPMNGWKQLEFSGQDVLINGGQFKSTYKIEGNKILIKIPVGVVDGELKGESIEINMETFKKIGAINSAKSSGSNNNVSTCLDKKINDFRKERGQDAPINHDVLSEWEADCSK